MRSGLWHKQGFLGLAVQGLVDQLLLALRPNLTPLSKRDADGHGKINEHGNEGLPFRVRATHLKSKWNCDEVGFENGNGKWY